MSRSKTPGDDPDQDVTDTQAEDQTELETADADRADTDDSPEVWVDEDDASDADDESTDSEATYDSVDDVSLSEEDQPSAEKTVEDAEVVENAEVLDDTRADRAELPAPRPEPAPASGGGAGFVPLLLGGLIAGGIGYAAAYFQPDAAVEPPAAVDLSGVEGNIAAQVVRVDALEAALADIGSTDTAPAFDSSALEGQQAELRDAFGGIETALDGLRTDFAALSDRVTALENAPDTPLTPDGAQAMAEQLSAFQAELDAVTETARTEIEAVQERASAIEAAAIAAEADAQRRAALAELQAALESGQPYADVLDAFETVPDGLAAQAGDGVATLSELRDSFPAAARAALAETQTVPEDGGMGDRLTAFLRRQTNARSLSPREGDDPDAVLSRAEAALASGDLNAALVELDALPEGAAAQFEDWRSQVNGRLDALNGAETLAASANEN